MRLYTVNYISANCSTCFGWYLHPLSGAHVNCNYSIWHWSNRICHPPMSWTPPRQRKVAHTVRPVPDVVITVYICSWWWVKVSPETCTAVCKNIIKCILSHLVGQLLTCALFHHLQKTTDGIKTHFRNWQLKLTSKQLRTMTCNKHWTLMMINSRINTYQTLRG